MVLCSDFELIFCNAVAGSDMFYPVIFSMIGIQINLLFRQKDLIGKRYAVDPVKYVPCLWDVSLNQMLVCLAIG